MKLHVLIAVVTFVVVLTTGADGSATPTAKPKPFKTLKHGCVTNNKKSGVGCRVYKTKWPGIVLYSQLQDPYKGTDQTVTLAESNLWAGQIVDTLNAIDRLPSGRVLLNAVSTAVCRTRNIGVSFAPFNTGIQDINVAIRHGKVCLENTRARTQSAGATDLASANDPKRGSDVVMDIDTCTMRGQALVISVAHELIHAMHHLHGKRDDCSCCEEGRTTGIFGELVGCSQDGITENKLRSEMSPKMPRRETYPDCNFESMAAACPSNSGNKCTQKHIMDRKDTWCAASQAPSKSASTSVKDALKKTTSTKTTNKKTTSTKTTNKKKNTSKKNFF